MMHKATSFSAGAGSIFESLRAEKKLVVVVNEGLMDNHQDELAEAMQAGGHAAMATPDTLLATLEAAGGLDGLPCTPLPPVNPRAAVDEVNKVLGGRRLALLQHE